MPVRLLRAQVFPERDEARAERAIVVRLGPRGGFSSYRQERSNVLFIINEAAIAIIPRAAERWRRIIFVIVIIIGVIIGTRSLSLIARSSGCSSRRCATPGWTISRGPGALGTLWSTFGHTALNIWGDDM